MSLGVAVELGGGDGGDSEGLLAYFERLFRHLEHAHEVVVARDVAASAVASGAGRTSILAGADPTALMTDAVVVVVGLQACPEPRGDVRVDGKIRKDGVLVTPLKLCVSCVEVRPQSSIP